MKINNLGHINNFSPNLTFGKTEKSEAKEIKSDASSLDCLEASGRILVKTPKEIIKKAEEIIQKTLSGNETIKKRTYIDNKKDGNIVFIQIGEPIEGFRDIYDDKKRAACHFDKEGNFQRAFVMDKSTNETDVYDSSLRKKQHFTKEERDALYYYKYHPDEIHRVLRENRRIYSGAFREEADHTIDVLDGLFSNPDKVFRTNENLTLYRALQKNLTEEEIETLSTLGEFYEDKSFSSTTTNLDVAKSFSSGNPILEINFPRNSKYMDIEGIFNIDRRHWREDELLLNRNSKFFITGYDTENNIIKCEYVGD